MKRLSRIWWIFGGVALILVSCVGAFLLTWGNSYVICFGTPFPSYESVERSAIFKLPPSARNIEYDANGVNRKGGCTIWVKFEMTSDDLTSFAETTLVRELSASVVLNQQAFNYFSSKQGWHQPKNSLAGYADDYTKLVTQWVFIDTSDQTNWIAYIITNYEWL